MKTNKTISEFKEFIAKGNVIYGLKIQVGTATITYGNFIQNVVDFLIVAACIFAMLKYLAHFKKTTNDQLDQKRT